MEITYYKYATLTVQTCQDTIFVLLKHEIKAVYKSHAFQARYLVRGRKTDNTIVLKNATVKCTFILLSIDSLANIWICSESGIIRIM